MSEYIKKTLQELMDDELSQMNLPSEFGTLKSFINDGKKSAEFIRYVLEDKPYNILKNSSPLYETSELRARHSAVTFLLGLVFSKFEDLFATCLFATGSIASKFSEDFIRIYILAFIKKCYSSIVLLV